MTSNVTAEARRRFGIFKRTRRDGDPLIAEVLGELIAGFMNGEQRTNSGIAVPSGTPHQRKRVELIVGWIQDLGSAAARDGGEITHALWRDRTRRIEKELRRVAGPPWLVHDRATGKLLFRIKWQPRLGFGAVIYQLENYLQDGDVARIRRCLHCEKWLYARRARQKFCSEQCRVKQYFRTPQGRKKWAEYMRKYRAHPRVRARKSKTTRNARRRD